MAASASHDASRASTIAPVRIMPSLLEQGQSLRFLPSASRGERNGSSVKVNGGPD
jgi:hypothetical protein